MWLSPNPSCVLPMRSRSAMQLISSSCSQYAISARARTRILSATRITYLSSPARRRLVVRSLLPNERRIRFSDLVSSVPTRIDLYFTSPSRRALFGGIALLGGFYVAQTISLSFGALGVNDVVAAALSVLGTELDNQSKQLEQGTKDKEASLRQSETADLLQNRGSSQQHVLDGGRE